MPTHDELVARKAARIQEIHRMDPARTALLVIDMQRSFMDPSVVAVRADGLGDPARRSRGWSTSAAGRGCR